MVRWEPEDRTPDISFGIGEQMAELYKVLFEDIRKVVTATKKLANESPAKKATHR